MNSHQLAQSRCSHRTPSDAKTGSRKAYIRSSSRSDLANSSSSDPAKGGGTSCPCKRKRAAESSPYQCMARSRSLPPGLVGRSYISCSALANQYQARPAFIPRIQYHEDHGILPPLTISAAIKSATHSTNPPSFSKRMAYPTNAADASVHPKPVTQARQPPKTPPQQHVGLKVASSKSIISADCLGIAIRS